MKELLYEIIEKHIPQVEKKLNYKLFSRNELSASGDLHLPHPLLENADVIAKSIGIMLQTELKNLNFTYLESPIINPHDFAENQRYDYETVNLDFYLASATLYLTNNNIYTIFDVENTHLYFEQLNDYYRLIQLFYTACNFAFLDSKLLYFTNFSEGNISSASFLFESDIRLYTFDYIRYNLLRYGSVTANEFTKSMRRKRMKKQEEEMLT